MNLTRKAFKAYLEAMNPNDIAGRRDLPMYCPIAEYYHASMPNLNNVHVERHEITTNVSRKILPHYQGTNRTRKTPIWVGNFIGAIDDCAVPYDSDDYAARVDAVGSNDAGNVVTARECLAALEKTHERADR